MSAGHRPALSRAAAALACGILTACGPARDASRADSVATAATPAGSSGRSATFAAESAAAARDEWNRAEVVKRLTEAGLVVTDSGESVRQPFLSVPGALVRVGGYPLQLYIYPDTLARSRDSAPLDSARAAPRGTVVDWEHQPTMVTSGNLLAIILTPRTQLAERVALTLTSRHLGIGR